MFPKYKKDAHLINEDMKHKQEISEIQKNKKCIIKSVNKNTMKT